jgi:hypothetical protein
MSNKAKLSVLAILILIVAVYLWNQGREKKQSTQPATKLSSIKDSPSGDNSVGENTDSVDANFDQADQDFSAQCEKGEWVKIADIQGNITSATGILHWVDTESDAASKQFENYTHYLDGKEKIALINPAAKTEEDTNNLDLFQGREVEVQGILKQTAVKEMQVSQVRCTGSETDKNIAASRVAMLQYISGNIGSIAPEKAPYQKWSVDSAIILNEKDVYVDYYDTIEDADNSDPNLDTVHRVLLEIAPKDGGGYEAKVLAYYVPGEDEMSLKSGTDKFKNQDETAFPFYTYDSEENSWTRD